MPSQAQSAGRSWGISCSVFGSGQERYRCDRFLHVSQTYSVDHRLRQQLHPIVPLLDAFKTEQQPLAFVLPRKGPFDPHPQRMDGSIEESLASALGRLALARILFDVGDEARMEN